MQRLPSSSFLSCTNQRDPDAHLYEDAPPLKQPRHALPERDALGEATNSSALQGTTGIGEAHARKAGERVLVPAHAPGLQHAATRGSSAHGPPCTQPVGLAWEQVGVGSERPRRTCQEPAVHA